jgi:hypothetical protein
MSCAHCNKPLEWRPGGRIKKYCGAPCRTAYWRVHGRGAPMPDWRDTAMVTFQRYLPDGLDQGCWLWQGRRSPSGYGVMAATVKGRVVSHNAHRWSWLLYRGDIAEGLHVDHICRVPLCVNPSHLQLLTPEQNNERRRPPRRKTHCGKGHEFTPENTGVRKQSGSRYCKQCSRERAKQHAGAR